MILTTKDDRVVLRNLESDDLDLLYDWLNIPEIANWFAFTRLPSSKVQTNRFLESQLNGDDKNIHLVIADIKENLSVGIISLKNINWIDRNAEYAIVLANPSFMRKGYATISSEAIIAYAFQTLNLHRLYLSVLKTNTRAIKLYEKLGFRNEGKFIEHVFLNGAYIDLCWYGLTHHHKYGSSSFCSAAPGNG